MTAEPSERISMPDAAGADPAAFMIRRDGTWTYQGSGIPRPALVRLFAGMLRRDAAGGYWLVNKSERQRIVVEDVPFLAVELRVGGQGSGQTLDFRTNVDDWVAAGPEHAIRVEADGGSRGPGFPIPYLEVRDGIEARIARPVYYQLVDLAVPRATGDAARVGIWSRGIFFELGVLPQP
ncbi:MAG: DUF1285 domain-containing protein [Azospirillaceae bacterium]|nr:DUF1285 domain-containing protein [Azospirillaceae bacterium]